MAITGAQLVQDTMFKAGVLGQDGTTQPNGDADVQLVLRVLNRLLDAWSVESMILYATSTETLALSTGVATYSSTLLAGGRPVSVDSMNVTYAGVNYPIEKINASRYALIGIPTIQAIPQACYIDMTFPNAAFTFFPVPYAPMVANVECERVLQPTAITVATNITFPPGYEKAIIDNLAVEICPYFGFPVEPALLDAAKKSLAKLKIRNFVPGEMTTDFDTDTSYALANIYKPW